MRHTYKKDYRAHLVYRDGYTVDAVIPDGVAANQLLYDGKTFTAYVWLCGQWVRQRVRLDGAAYGLDTPGTGDPVVRPG